MRQSHTITITGAGPFAGWDFAITHTEHGGDAIDDLYRIELWPPDADKPAHQFQTYQHAYGWKTINTALAAAGIRVDACMHATLDWWTQHHTSTPYEIHRVLVAIDDTVWATKNEIADRLAMGIDHLDEGTPYGHALTAAQHHGLITWREKSATPFAALTPAGYELIHPDDQPAGDAAQQRLAACLATDRQKDPTPPPPAAGKAFPTITTVTAQPTPSHPTGPAPAVPAVRQAQPAL